MNKSLALLGRFFTITVFLSALIITAGLFDFNSIYTQAIENESHEHLDIYEQEAILESYKTVLAHVSTISADTYLKYLNLTALDDFLIVRFVIPLFHLKQSFAAFAIFCISTLGFYKKVYEKKNIAEQKMRVMRVNAPLFMLLHFTLCVQPFFINGLLSISLILMSIYLAVNKYYYIMGLSSHE